MTPYEFIGILAGLMSFIGWIIYNISIINKKTRPNRVTWFTLTLLGLLILLTYYDGGARDTIWVSLVYVLGPAMTTILSIFYYGEGGWSKFDKGCILFLGIGLILWFFLRDLSLPVLIISLSIDFVGLLPTIKKSWTDPKFENPTAWSLESVSSILNLFAVTSWSLSISSLSIWIYPVYMVLINSLIACILFVRIRYLK